METNLQKFGKQGMLYKYDQLNRLTQSRSLELSGGDYTDEMRYWQGERQTIVTFSIFDIHPKFPPEKFDEKKYIEKKGKAYRPSAEYKEYRFIDNELSMDK